MERCVIASKSINLAIKAQNALSDEAIQSKIIKVDPKSSRYGCSYGLQYDCQQKNNVERILNEQHIPFSRASGR